MIFAGFPAIMQWPSGKLLVTIEPAPTVVCGPSVTPGRITLFIPIQHFSPMFISRGGACPSAFSTFWFALLLPTSCALYVPLPPVILPHAWKYVPVIWKLFKSFM